MHDYDQIIAGVKLHKPLRNELDEMRKLLEELEVMIFLYLRYPQVTYERRQLVTTDKNDEEFIEKVFGKFSPWGRYFPQHPLSNVIYHHRNVYEKLKRLNSKKPVRNFYFEVIKQMFLYVYEARLSLTERNIKETYLNRGDRDDFDIAYCRRY